MKRKIVLSLILCLAVTFTACLKTEKKNNKQDINLTQNQEGVTFTDSLGRELTVSKADRVVTLLGSFCDEWMAAGGSVVGTASDTFTSYDFVFDESVANTGSNLHPDVETFQLYPRPGAHHDAPACGFHHQYGISGRRSR